MARLRIDENFTQRFTGLDIWNIRTHEMQSIVELNRDAQPELIVKRSGFFDHGCIAAVHPSCVRDASPSVSCVSAPESFDTVGIPWIKAIKAGNVVYVVFARDFDIDLSQVAPGIQLFGCGDFVFKRARRDGDAIGVIRHDGDVLLRCNFAKDVVAFIGFQQWVVDSDGYLVPLVGRQLDGEFDVGGVPRDVYFEVTLIVYTAVRGKSLQMDVSD